MNWAALIPDAPFDWALIPLNGRKRPIDPATGDLLEGWQNQPGYDVDGLAALNGCVKAAGLLLGPPSGGILAVDFDGLPAPAKFEEIYGRKPTELPPTIGVTSGKPGRGQRFFQVDQDWWPHLRSRREWKHNGNTCLELRWAGCQSVIAGAHPETGSYKWLPNSSPAQREAALAPDWLLEPLLRQEQHLDPVEPSTADAERAVAMLQCIDPAAHTSYDSWLDVGMALHHTDPGLLTAWCDWSKQMPNFDEAECLAKWESFEGYSGSRLTIRSLHHWAKDGGYKEPKRKTNQKPVAQPSGVAQGDYQSQLASVADVVNEANSAAALTLDPLALIGGVLGQAIVDRADRLHVPSAVLLNGLLPVAASQLPRATSVLLCEDSDYRQPPILWSLSVAPTGSNKSETSDVAVKPLYRFQDDLTPDQERHYFTSSFTLPGLARVQVAQPDRGCLINPDELSGFVRKLQSDQQRGTTDELSRMLSIYDGRPLRGNFSDKSLNYQLKGSSFSLLSTIQPSVLLECMGDLDDASGLWARFNLCEIPAKRRRISRTGRSADGLMPALQAAYLCLQQWEPRAYGLTDEAAELFDTFYDSCEDQRRDQTLQPALQAYAAKQEGRCGRIALVLHCLQAAARKVPPTAHIEASTMLGAIAICDFYQQQLRRFYTLALAQASESLEGNALLVFEFIKREAGKPCTTRQINKGPRALRRMTTRQIEESLAALAQQNLIRQSGDGWQLTTV